MFSFVIDSLLTSRSQLRLSELFKKVGRIGDAPASLVKGDEGDLCSILDLTCTGRRNLLNDEGFVVLFIQTEASVKVECKLVPVITLFLKTFVVFEKSLILSVCKCEFFVQLVLALNVSDLSLLEEAQLLPTAKCNGNSTTSDGGNKDGDDVEKHGKFLSKKTTQAV